MEELIRVLESTVSNSQTDQNEAVRYIQEFMSRDLNGFLRALSDILYNQQNQPVVRAAAGLQLKNQLTARDETLRHQQQERWRTLPLETRQYIKDRVFGTLGTEPFRPSSAPQCIAYIALAELAGKEWPGFMQALVQNAKGSATNDKLKLAILEAIGYVCQEIISSEHLQISRRREITNGLNSSMAIIYSYIGDCINSRNYDLMTTALQCLQGLLSWASFNKDSIRFLCQLMRDNEIQPGQVPFDYSDQKLAIISSICECLNACLEKKHSKPDSIDVRTHLFEDETNLRAIITTLDEISRLPTQQNNSNSVADVQKKLSQVLTNIVRYIHIGPPEKPQNLQDIYSIMKVIIAHSSISVSIEGVRFWNKVFVVAVKRPNPSISDDLTASLLITCANKLIRAPFDVQLYDEEFECQQEFDLFQSRYRSEVCELCRNLTSQNERICFELVCNSIAKSIQQQNTNLNEWDALSSLAAAVCAKLKDTNVYVMNGVELIKALMIYMDSALVQAASIPPNTSGHNASLIPDLISNQLSCISALFVFLPHWHQTDKELTKEILNKLISYAFHRPDKFINSSRQLVGNNTSLLNNEEFLKGFRALSRHASASFVRVCLNHPKHLLDIFAHLKASIDCLYASVVDNPFSSEKCQLYEGLTLICNEEPNQLVRKKFILELFESIRWFQDYELTCDQFIEFVGLDRREVEQKSLDPQDMISQPVPASQLNRVKLSYVITFIGAIVKRLNSRATLLPEILAFTKPILNLIFTMHALWLPEMKAKCVKEYQPILFAPFNNAYKQQILETVLVKSSSTSESNNIAALSSGSDTSPFGNAVLNEFISRPSKGNEQYIELFSWNFYEALLNTMGAIINRTTPEVFTYINSIQLQTALTGAEYLPPLKMHKLIRQFIMPLVTNCSKDPNLIESQLLPLLSKLLPFLFETLDNQWKKAAKEEEGHVNGVSNSEIDQNQKLRDEMVQDQLLRNLSRDFIDLMNLILVETVQVSAGANENSNDASAHNFNNATNPPNRGTQDLNKISRLGLNLLAAGPDFIMKVMATSLTWSDSTLNAKAIFINQQLIKHIIASITSIDTTTSLWLGCMFESVITSLRMFGEHEHCCSGLLTLFLYLYENLNKTIPNFHDQLQQMTGIPKTAFIGFDQGETRANEKTKRAGLRKILDSLVGKK